MTPTHQRLACGTRVGPDTGSVSLELAVIAPALLAFLAMVIAGGRVAIADQAVAQAAAQAARDASLTRSSPAGAAAAHARVAAVLDGQGLLCAEKSVLVDAGALNAAAGTPGKVSVAVSCTVNWSDLALPGVPGRATLRAEGTSPVERWVGR